MSSYDDTPLILHKFGMVGARGFEPPTSCSQGRRANQAALRPDRMPRHGGLQIAACAGGVKEKAVRRRDRENKKRLRKTVDATTLSCYSDAVFQADPG